MKITKRDLTFFLLGIFSLLVFDAIVNWKEVKKELIRGYNEAQWDD